MPAATRGPSKRQARRLIRPDAGAALAEASPEDAAALEAKAVESLAQARTATSCAARMRPAQAPFLSAVLSPAGHHPR